jgi:small subunit ribosomal protein S16
VATGQVGFGSEPAEGEIKDRRSSGMLKIRLRRMGKKKAPFYRLVVSDSRKTPIGSALEELGYYDPRQNPPRIEIDSQRVQHWLDQGAQMSDTVKKIFGRV